MDTFLQSCLAVFMKKEKKKQLTQSKKESSQILCDDLVFEIILLLPLKYAIQCKTLNKNLYDYISHPAFKYKHALLSSTHIHNSTILYKPSYSPFGPGPFTTAEVSVSASSNGLLLLSFNCYSKPSYIPHYVFNPITGQALAVHHRMQESEGPPGLVVDLGGDETFYHPSFKLVMINKTRDMLTCEVIVPSGSSTRLKSYADFVCKSFTWLQVTRPVYLNGALHWLGNGLSKIFVFNVEKEQGKIISGPARLLTGDTCRIINCMWYGSVMGSLSFVSTSKSEITIHIHDYVNDEWRIQHKIANIVPNKWDKYWNPGVPLFFDGENLFFQVEEIEEAPKLFVHKISRRRWEMKKNVGVLSWNPYYRAFVPFLPTLAKVFDSDDDDDNHPHKNNKGLKIKGPHNYHIPVVYDRLRRVQKQFLRLLTE